MRDGYGRGVELMIRRPPGPRFYGWLAYTLSESVRDFQGVSGPSDWDQRHILNLVAGLRLPRNYTLGGRFHYASGRPFPVYAAGQVTEYRRLPAFYQLDLRFDRRWYLDRFIVDGYIEIANATLTRQVTEYTRNDAGQITEGSVRVFLPSLGVRIEF
jgi:hypothetical protein